MSANIFVWKNGHVGIMPGIPTCMDHMQIRFRIAKKPGSVPDPRVFIDQKIPAWVFPIDEAAFSYYVYMNRNELLGTTAKPVDSAPGPHEHEATFLVMHKDGMLFLEHFACREYVDDGKRACNVFRTVQQIDRSKMAPGESLMVSPHSYGGGQLFGLLYGDLGFQEISNIAAVNRFGTDSPLVWYEDSDFMKMFDDPQHQPTPVTTVPDIEALVFERDNARTNSSPPKTQRSARLRRSRHKKTKTSQ